MSEQQDEGRANLISYLKDHGAGAFGALELIGHLRESHRDSALGEFFTQLHADVTADDEVLQSLLKELDAGESGIRKASAWIMEKMSQLKIGAEKNSVGGLGLLEAIEGLALGIRGKQLLWRALAAASATVPELRSADYQQLEARAVAQQERVEAQRLLAAREAFGR